MNAAITDIYRYPVKGLGGEMLNSIALEKDCHMPGDRRFAFRRRDNRADRERPVWEQRDNFLVLARDAWLAGLVLQFDDAECRLTVSPSSARAGGVSPGVASFALSDADERERFKAYILAYGGSEAEPLMDCALLDGWGLSAKPSGTTVIPQGAFGFTDSSRATVSVINRQTVAAMAEAFDADIDIRRFRGNLIIDAPAWSEFEWENKSLQIGSAAFTFDKRIDRCAATTVHPDTGIRDLQIPKLLSRNFGHVDCGVCLRVTQSGTVRVGDAVAF